MADRLRTLTILERLQRHEMEAEARELAMLRSHVAILERACDDLLDRLQNEARIVTLESAPYVGSFIRAIRNEVAQKKRAVATINPRIEALETALASRFREIGTIKIAAEKARTKLRVDRARREALETDALTLLRWGRHTSASGSRIS